MAVTKLIIAPLLLKLLVVTVMVVGHENDRKCYPAVQPTGTTPTNTTTAGWNTTTAPNSTKTNVTGFPSTTVPPVRRAVTAVDVTHEYTNSYGSVTKKAERRVFINSGDSTIENFYASSFSKANPRELMLQFDGSVVTAAIGEYYEFYNSVTGTDVKWTCHQKSINLGGSITFIFSTYGTYRHGQFSWRRDRIAIRVADSDQPIGSEQDLECFDIMYPSVYTQGRHSGAAQAILNVTQMYYDRVGSTQWCCSDTWNKTEMLVFKDGEIQVHQIQYEPSQGGGFALKNKNPRNVTIQYKRGQFHIAMANLANSRYADSSSAGGWRTNEEWTCKER